MKYSIFKESVTKHLCQYKENVLGCKDSGTWKCKNYEHILPKNLEGLNFIANVAKPNLKYHIYSHHLNSSQVMCINFFQPIENGSLLIDLLREAVGLNIPKDSSIKKSRFEYNRPDFNDGSNFDFYIELSCGEKIYFEIKYTEDGFGKISKSSVTDVLPEKYIKKFDEVYVDQLSRSLYLKDLTIDKLYKNYQIYRNISYIRSEKDHVIFIYPEDNENLIKEVEKIEKFPNVHLVLWEDLVNKILDLTKGEDNNFYKEFKRKYLDYKK